jgi:hypothetical protein
MNDIYKISPIILMLTVFAALTACGPKSLAVKEDHAFSVDISGLELDKSEAPTIVYKRPGAPDLGAYDRFIIDPVRIVYDDPRMKELSPEQVGRMMQYLRDSVINELRDAGYEVGTRSQAGTMRISFTISGLKAPTALPNVTAALAPFAVSVGEVTVEGIFREAVKDRIDAVAVNRARGARVLNPRPWTTWGDVESALNIWAKGIREAVDKAHGR